MKSKTIWAFDPNKWTLMSGVGRRPEDHLKTDDPLNPQDPSKDYKETLKFLYTTGERNYDSQKKRNKQITRYLLTEYYNQSNVDVKGLDKQMMQYNSKTLIFTEYLKYLRAKEVVRNLVLPFYNNPLIRRLRFNMKFKVKQSVKKLIAKMIENIGDPKDNVIVFGDGGMNTNGMKMGPPTLGIGLRRIIRKGGYQTYLVNEAYTSKKCSHCQSDEEDKGICGPFPKEERTSNDPFDKEIRSSVRDRELMKNTNGNKDRKRYRRYTAAKDVKGTREMIQRTRDIHGLRKCNT